MLKFNKIFLFSIFINFYLFNLHSQEQKNWTVAVYMEDSDASLAYWKDRNLNAMATAKFDNKFLNLVVQVHATPENFSRYNICDNKLNLINTENFLQNSEQNVINFMQFIKDNYPAKHYALIMWNHGFGVLDPKNNPDPKEQFAWDVEPDEPEYVCVDGVCPIKNIEEQINHANHINLHKGFMFEGNKTFINNSQMVYMLKTIKEKVLDNNKLDILGTDCCKMSMLEVAYQIKDYANYLVGSQNCELVDGWDYNCFFNNFKKDNITVLDVLSFISQSYSDYYRKNTKENSYTLSAINLSKINNLVNNFNDIIVTCKNIMLKHKQEFSKLIFDTRENTLNMCSSSYYRDLGMFYLNLLESICKLELDGACAQCIRDLKNFIITGLNLLKDCVVYNVIGTAVSKMHGLAFYFPRNKIDESYLDTIFAKDTEWVNFLREIIN